MKRFLIVLLSLVLITAVLSGCAGKNNTPGQSGSTAQTSGNSGSTNTSEPTSDNSTSLAKIKQAAIDAGYVVTDDYQALFLEDVKGGFSVEIVADDKDIIYSVLECGSKENAEKNAKTIDEAGYNIAITNGKILSFYGVDEKNGTGKDILISIVKGNPVSNK